MLTVDIIGRWGNKVIWWNRERVFWITEGMDSICKVGKLRGDDSIGLAVVVGPIAGLKSRQILWRCRNANFGMEVLWEEVD